jgi:hypothetical protein
VIAVAEEIAGEAIYMMRGLLTMGLQYESKVHSIVAELFRIGNDGKRREASVAAERINNAVAPVKRDVVVPQDFAFGRQLLDRLASDPSAGTDD